MIQKRLRRTLKVWGRGGVEDQGRTVVKGDRRRELPAARMGS